MAIISFVNSELKCTSISSVFFLHMVMWVGRLFTNSPGDMGSIPSRVIPKTLKMVLDASLLNTQQYKVRIKGKVEQSKEKGSPPYTSV